MNHRAVRLGIGLLLAVVAIRPAALSARTVLEAGGATVWKYLDSGREPGAGWARPGFDDSQWKVGKAPLGYGDPRLGTQVRSRADDGHQAITNWFRCQFKAPELGPGERLILLGCVDDGAVIYLNGEEVGRINMPGGPVSAATFASRVIGDPDEGFYARQNLPTQTIRVGEMNILAVEVHQGAASSSDLFLDVALKVLPVEGRSAEVSAAVQDVVNLFNKKHFVGPGVKIPDGYLDGGRGMKVDATGHATSRREILAVDRSRDVELAADLEFARSPELRALAPLERIQRLAAHIDQKTTPPGGLRWVGKTTEQLEKEFENKPVFIGDWIDQCQAGVCRHRALLFKIFADEAGLRAALVRGNFAKDGPPGFAHAWNEVLLDDGRRVLVDVMHNGGKPKFLEITAPYVVEHYLKVDGTPWYSAAPN